MDTVIPKKTAFKANQKETFSNLDTKNCHLIASIDQLTNIRKKLAQAQYNCPRLE